MTISATELKIYKSVTVSDAAANGGRMSANEIVSLAKNNLFPDVSESARTAGETKYRKTFMKVANDADETASAVKIHMTTRSAGDDYEVIIPGNNTDTQGAMSSSTEYGVARLKTSVLAAATSFVVTLDAAALIIYRNADKIWISDGANTEYHANATIVKVGADVTITLAGGDSLANGYSNANTVVSSVIEPGDIKTATSAWTETVAGDGTYDETNYPLVLDNIGTVYDNWTITFTDATNFACAGASVGSLAAGAKTTDYSPNNADFTKPYFTLYAAGFAGTWAAGDTITFTTSPAAAAIWHKRTVPAGSASIANDNYSIRLACETAVTTTTTTSTSTSSSTSTTVTAAC
jgi:hypothetical protein